MAMSLAVARVWVVGVLLALGLFGISRSAPEGLQRFLSSTGRCQEGDAACVQKRRLSEAEVEVEAMEAEAEAEAKAAEVEGAKDVKLEAAVSVSVATTDGRCSGDDEEAMRKLGGGTDDGSFPKVVSTCGKASYSWVRFNKVQMKECLKTGAGLSDSCAACFSEAGLFSFTTCKLECVFNSWCSRSCLTCAKQYAPTVKACAGVDIPRAEPC